MPTQIDRKASSGVNTTWASTSEPRRIAEATAGLANSIAPPTKTAYTA